MVGAVWSSEGRTIVSVYINACAVRDRDLHRGGRRHGFGGQVECQTRGHAGDGFRRSHSPTLELGLRSVESLLAEQLGY